MFQICWCYYQYKDHLGNTRLNFGRDENGVLFKEDSNDYYPFGLNFINPPGQIAQLYNPSATYRNWKMQGQELQETGFYQYKWRHYIPDVARFFNIDPLAEKYTHNSTYAFSENRVIDARELEGLEAVKLNEGTKNLIIAVQGWDNGNPDPGKTQVRPDTGGFASALVEAYGAQKDTQVAVFGASWISRTPNDISTSIKNFRAQSPDGKLILVGHSMGGDNIVNVANDNSQVKIDKLITLDISDPMGVADNKIPSNVVEAKNYYQTNNPFIGGTQVTPTSENTTSKVTNVPTNDTTNHTNIDEKYSPNVVNDVKQVIPTN